MTKRDPRNCPFLWMDPGPHIMPRVVPRVLRVDSPNGISIGSAILAQLALVTNRQTDRPCYSGTIKNSFTEHRVPELIPVLGGQPAGDVNHKPHSRLPLFSARPAVTPATLKRAATNFAAW